MGRKKCIKEKRLIVADFETTVYEGQTETEVWSAAYAELYTDKVTVRHSMDEFLNDMLRGYSDSIVCWFHNVRFDGSFIVDYLLRKGWKFSKEKNGKMFSGEFKALISQQNRWYSVTLKYGNKTVEFRDSAKLMPMTLAEMGVAFNTSHRKLNMEYKGYRYAGCVITPEEMKYIINDVLVLKEAMETMLNDGHDRLTIGSCCMAEYKKQYDDAMWNAMFPDLKAFTIETGYGANNADEYIRKAYHGGWCYLRKEYLMFHVKHKGRTYDVNSLYPSMMHSSSGNYYPVGLPHFFKGLPPEICKRKDIVYFIRLRCCFNLKPKHVPTIQIRKSWKYPSNEWLETSDVKFRGEYYHELENDETGEMEVQSPEMTMSMVDYKLMLEHYDVTDLEILDGVWFYGELGIFDAYLDKYKKIKETATGGLRTEAKLFSNNLYGKLATGDDSSYLVPYISPDTDAIAFDIVYENDKRTVCIAKGAMVTSYARAFTITHAQENYNLFIYADTDSLHGLDGEWKNIQEHDTAYGCWKCESEWSSAIFIRQKTYAEFIRKEHHKKVEAHWDIKCAGMPEASKQLFLATHPITDFKYGLRVGGKLKPVRIHGGTILTETDFTLRKKY